MRYLFCHRPRFFIGFLIPLGLISVLLLAAGWGWEAHGASALPSMPDPLPRDRILVIAPHPDDEMLACGGLIRRAVERGADVHVALVTSGDAFSIVAHRLYPQDPFTPALFEKLGETRMAESRRALARMGLPSSRIIFLGYPDGGIEGLWTAYWNRPLKSYRTRTIRSPYRRSGLPSAIYSGGSLLNDLETLLKKYRPTTVLFPHPGDFNRDHRSVSAFTMMALNRLREDRKWVPPREAAYVIHWGAGWPSPSAALTTAPARLPAALFHPQEQWRMLTLDREDALRKRAAITDYRSQYASLFVSGFLNSFARKTEPFSARVRSRPLPAGESLYEPVGSAHSDLFTESSDVTGVQVTANASSLAVRFTFLEPPTPDILCQLDLRTLESSGSTRWLTGSWKLNGPRLNPLGTCSLSDRTVEWRIPREKLGEANRVFVSVGTVIGRKETDRSAWTLWSLPPLAPKITILSSRPHRHRRSRGTQG